MTSPLRDDDDAGKGAVEQDRPGQKTNVDFDAQLPHRTDNKLVKASDTDYPEPGENPEHSGELMARNDDRTQQNPDDQRNQQRVNPEAETQDQDPGQRQKQNQNDKKDDDLAA